MDGHKLNAFHKSTMSEDSSLEMSRNSPGNHGGMSDNERESLLSSGRRGPPSQRQEMVGNTFQKAPILTWVTAILIFVLGVALIVVKVESDQRYSSLNTEVIALKKQLEATQKNYQTSIYNMQARLDLEIVKEAQFEEATTGSLATLNTRLGQQNVSTELQFHSVYSKVATHDAAIIKLTNGTSNAEVLDKLKLTKQQVDEQMRNTKGEVSQQLVLISENVTSQLSQNSVKLEATQQSISSFMNDTVGNIKSVMAQATGHIHEVQRNVTKEIDAMQSKVQLTVNDLSDSVRKAQDIIQQEVAEVRDNIESYVSITNKQFAAENDFVKYQLAGLFTLLSCLIFLWHLTSHMRHFYKPDVQKRITAILWMVPVYGVTSWISMMQPNLEPHLGAIRDCYEAYVVYTFVAMLVAILGDGKSLDDVEIQIAERIVEERREVEAYKLWQAQQRAATSSSSSTVVVSSATIMDVESQHLLHANGGDGGTGRQDDQNTSREEAVEASPLRQPKEHFHPPCPFCYRSQIPLSMAATWLWQCRVFALQFMIVKPLVTVIPLILTMSGAYDIDKIPPWQNNAIQWHSAKLYIVLMQNISVGLAFYGLLSFYHGAEKDLEWCDPWPKFLCIKGIVFATFWQSICIQAMSAFGLVDAKAASQINNFLICVEMLIASLAHFYVFPHHEWHPTYQKQRERTLLIQDTMALRDFVQDMRSMMTSRKAAARSGSIGDPSSEVAGEIDEVKADLPPMGHIDVGGKTAAATSGNESSASYRHSAMHGDNKDNDEDYHSVERQDSGDDDDDDDNSDSGLLLRRLSSGENRDQQRRASAFSTATPPQSRQKSLVEAKVKETDHLLGSASSASTTASSFKSPDEMKYVQQQVERNLRRLEHMEQPLRSTQDNAPTTTSLHHRGRSHSPPRSMFNHTAGPFYQHSAPLTVESSSARNPHNAEFYTTASSSTSPPPPGSHTQSSPTPTFSSHQSTASGETVVVSEEDFVHTSPDPSFCGQPSQQDSITSSDQSSQLRPVSSGQRPTSATIVDDYESV